MLAAGPEVNKLYVPKFVVGEQNVFRLDVTVNHSLVLHKFQRLKYLFRYKLHLFASVHVLVILLVLQLLVLVQADAQEIRYQDDPVLHDYSFL